MKFGLSIPQFEAFGDVRRLAELAVTAEKAGWDGFFIWDHMLFDDLWHPVVDPWIALAAIAMSTEQIIIGPMITPLARRRPWKVARESVTLDHLSKGRLVLGVGLGSPGNWEFGFFGEETEAKIRAQKLDEGLEILLGLWSGEPFSYQGQHYQLQQMRFLPKPIQQPRIPIWVGGTWPNKAPFRRAARYDGVFPITETSHPSIVEWKELKEFIEDRRQEEEPYDYVHYGVTPGDDKDKAVAITRPFQEIGITWWMEDISPYGYGYGWSDAWDADIVEQLQLRIEQGPPNLN